MKNEPPDYLYENEDDETMSEKTFETITEDSEEKIRSGSKESSELFSCKFCLESFSDLNKMKMHLKIHDKAILGKKKKIECKYCLGIINRHLIKVA